MSYKRVAPFILSLGLCVTLSVTNAVAVTNHPQDLIAPPESATENSITLLWDKPDHYADVSVYYIYRNGKHIATSDKTNYTVKGLSPNKRYSFYVKACYAKGGLSSASRIIIARTKPLGAEFNVLDYGAKGDGTTINTTMIQKAIDDCTPEGTVYIPSGIFLTGALYLKSNMTLYIAKGATLQGSENPEDYLPKQLNRFEGWELKTYASLLNAGKLDRNGGYVVKHLSIRGEGTISGGGAILAQAMKKNAGTRGRGRLILLMNSQHVNIQGLTIENSPCWTIHYIYTDKIALHDLTINSDVLNGDGIDPDSSTDSYIFNCTFSTGDDCIAIKSGKNPEGYYIAKPTENVWISNCNFIKGHSIAIGSEMSGGVRNVLIRDCITGNLKYGLQIKGTKDRGGFVENIRVKDCQLRKITVYSSLGYNNDGDSAPVLPYYKNFSFSNIDMTKAEIRPLILIQGFSDESHYTQDVIFENIKLPSNAEISLDHCKDFTFKHVLTIDNQRPSYKIQHSTNIQY